MLLNRGNLRQRGTQRPLGRQPDLFIHLLLQTSNRLGVEDSLAQQPHLELRQWIAQIVSREFTRRPVETVIVGERMRVRPYHMTMHKRRPIARTAPGDRLLKCKIARHRIGAVDLRKVEVRKICYQPRDVPAGGVDLDRNRDCVFIVLDNKEHRQLGIGSGVERFPELPLAGRPFAERDINYLVAMELHILELPVVALALSRRFGMARKIPSRLGAAYRLKALSRRRRGLRHDMKSGMAPVRRHLAAAAGDICRCANTLQELLFRSIAQRQAERPVAIIRIKPIVARLQRESGRDQQRLVTSPGDLEEDFLLPLQHDLAVVHSPREIHQPVDLNHPHTLPQSSRAD